MYISAKLMEVINSLKHNRFQCDDDSFASFKSHFQNQKESQLFNSTPIKQVCEDNNRITELQKELDEIKKQIAKLMEHQCDQFQCSGYGTLSNAPECAPKSAKLPAPLPPPPPPMPVFSLAATPLKLEGKKKSIIPPIKNGLPTGKELLKDLKKVQLRKIDKSPGGGPIKKVKKINDPGDFLEAVLRRRFGLIQNSPESSIESISIEANDSFTSGTLNGNYEAERNLKITVT
ncbi:hypothetical protein RUM44_009991 [Polyplax serrata]|uniref:WH2 domain-containing protein n=1 Tax=Polyplax serrata TaxID=468196 RepID=A0ABR1AUK0_POLSC